MPGAAKAREPSDHPGTAGRSVNYWPNLEHHRQQGQRAHTLPTARRLTRLCASTTDVLQCGHRPRSQCWKWTQCSSAGERTNLMLGAPDGAPHSCQNSQQRTDTKLRRHPTNLTSTTLTQEERLCGPVGRKPTRCSSTSALAHVCSAHERSVCWVPPVLFPMEVITRCRLGNEAEAQTHSRSWQVSVCRQCREAQRENNPPCARSARLLKICNYIRSN